MSSWYIDLNGLNATGANSTDNPYSADQFFDLLQGIVVNGYSSADTDRFFLKGYYYNPSLVRDSLLNVSVLAWNLLEFGPWVIDSPLELDLGLVDFEGGVINLNTPDLCSIEALRNVMLIAQDTDSKFTFTGGLCEGSTLITKGTVGAIFASSTFTLKDSTVICENPIESLIATTVNVNNCVVNLVDGTGASEFYGGTNITKGTSDDTQYGWTAPLYSRLPYTGNTPSTRDINTLLSEQILITPQGVSSSVPNYTTSSVTVELSDGDHTGYEQGLHGEIREVDSGSVTNRKYASSGIGAWWFSQEDMEVDDIKSTEDAVFIAFSGGAYYKRSADQNSAFFRSGSLYKGTSTFPSFSSAITVPGVGDPYFNKANFSTWVRTGVTGVKLWELTDSTGTITYSKIEITGSSQLTVSNSNTVTLTHDITDTTWHLITMTVDQNNSYYVKVYVDKTLLSASNFRFELSSTGSNYRIYMPRIESAGKVVEISKPRFAITQEVLTAQTVNSIYDLEIGELPV